MTDSDPKVDILPLRLCTEIQLFDLCELNSCKHKKGRFCTDTNLLSRFEKIAENELRIQERFSPEETDGDESVDNDGYDLEDDEGGEEDDPEEE